MLTDSISVRVFMKFLNFILNIYENSFIEKIFSRICDFSKKQWNLSLLKKILFPETDGTLWQNSLFFKLITSPLNLIKKIPGRSVAEQGEKSSGIFYIFKNALNLPLSVYGKLIIFLVFGSGITMFLLQKNTLFNTLAFAAFAVIGVILLFMPCSFKSLLTSCKLVKLVGDAAFFDDIKNNSETSLADAPSNFGILCVLMSCLGLFCGYFGTAISFAAIIGTIGVFAVLYNVYIGVFMLAVLFPILPTMASAGLAVITFGSFILKLWREKNLSYIFTPFNMIIVAFLAITTVSSVAGFAPASSLKIIMLYAAFALVYMLIVNTVKTRQAWNILVKSMVICGVILAFYGLLQNFVFKSTTASWVDANMFQNIKTRVYATLDNPNVLGQYFIFTIPVAFAVLWKTKDEKSFLFYAFACLLMVACLLYTWSRSAWVGVVLALGIFLVVKDRRWFIVCLIALFLMPFVLPESILSRITSLGNTKDSSTAYRISIWRASFEMAKDYFLGGIGVGTDAYSKVYPGYALSGARTAYHSHNFYLQWIIETGIIGITVFFAFILRAYRQIVKIGEENTLVKNFAIALAGILVGYLFQAVAEHMWYNFKMVLMFFVYLGLLQSGLNISNTEKSGEGISCTK